MPVGRRAREESLSDLGGAHEEVVVPGAAEAPVVLEPLVLYYTLIFDEIPTT